MRKCLRENLWMPMEGEQFLLRLSGDKRVVVSRDVDPPSPPMGSIATLHDLV